MIAALRSALESVGGEPAPAADHDRGGRGGLQLRRQHPRARAGADRPGAARDARARSTICSTCRRRPPRSCAAGASAAGSSWRSPAISSSRRRAPRSRCRRWRSACFRRPRRRCCRCAPGQRGRGRRDHHRRRVPARAWQPSGLVDVAPADVRAARVRGRLVRPRISQAKSAAALRHASRRGAGSRSRRTCGDVLPELERLYLDDLMRTHDAVEGIDAFLARARAHLDGPVTAMTFDVEIVLRERELRGDRAAGAPHRAASAWTRRRRGDGAQGDPAGHRPRKNPEATDRYVALRGFSWIVGTDGGAAS